MRTGLFALLGACAIAAVGALDAWEPWSDFESYYDDEATHSAPTRRSRHQEPGTIWDEIGRCDDLSEFRDLIEMPEYAPYKELFHSTGKHTGVNMTLFAFNNRAVEKLREHIEYDEYKHFVALVKMILDYHIAPEVTTTDSLRDKTFIESYAKGTSHGVILPQGQVLQLVKDGKAIRITSGLPKKWARATIVVKDVLCTNGVLHVIDRVLMLPRHTTTMMSIAYLNAFVEASIKLGIAHELNYNKGLTIFAPVEEAFLHFFARYGDDIDAGDIEQILSYHIVDDQAVWYTDKLSLPETKQLQTRFGDDVLYVAHEQEKVFINDEEILCEDILTSNGVVHTIGRVLVPPSLLAQGKFQGYNDEE